LIFTTISYYSPVTYYIKMVKIGEKIRCTHCKKEIKDKVKLVGLSFVCPYCDKPCEKIS